MLLILYHEKDLRNPFGFDYVPLATFRFKLSLQSEKDDSAKFLADYWTLHCLFCKKFSD